LSKYIKEGKILDIHYKDQKTTRAICFGRVVYTIREKDRIFLKFHTNISEMTAQRGQLYKCKQGIAFKQLTIIPLKYKIPPF